MILLALSISSCSSSGQDDITTPEPTPTPTPNPKPEPQQVGIAFGGSSGAWQDAPTSRTRTEDGKAGLETLFPSFRIWGYKTTDANTHDLQTVMQGYNVLHTSASSGSTTTNTDDWEYVGLSNTALNTTQTIKYWDYSATSYRFLGYTQLKINDKEVKTKTENFGISNENAGIENNENTETGNTAADNASTEPSQTFSIPYTYSDQAKATTTPYLSELWFSKAPSANEGGTTTNEGEPSSNYGKSVTITFAPVIAKVRFKFTYPDDIQNINIQEIRFCDSRYQSASSTDNNPDADAAANTPLNGTINAKYSLGETSGNKNPELSWTTSTAENSKGKLIFTTPYEEKDASIHITPSVSEYSKWYYCLPYASFASTDDTADTFEQGNYTITARIEGNHSTATVPKEYMQWKAGYQYTYTFKITEAGTQITFADVKVEQWQTAPNTDNNGSGTAGW